MNLRTQGFPALIAVTALGIASRADNANAQSYPTKPIRVVIPGAPGSNTDIFFRVVSPKMGTALGQQRVADYRAGAGRGVTIRGELQGRAKS